MKPIKLTGIAPESMYIRYRKSLRDYYKNDYNKMWKEKFFEAETLEDQMAWLQYMFRYDLFFMMYYGLNRTDINGFDLPFILQACRKIENGPQTDTVDLWARGHYKSSLITQGKSLQDMFRYDDLGIGFFSHTRPIAKGFLIPVKTALEDNILLKFAFPHKLWENPKKDAKVWSLDEGLELKRSSTSNTRSFEAWGLVDGMPAALSVNTPMLTTKGWKLHGDLGVGDFVYDEYGKPVEVIFNTGPMENKNCYHIKFRDTEMIAEENHLWPIDRFVFPRNEKTGEQLAENKHIVRSFVSTVNLPVNGKNRSRVKHLLRTPIIQIPENKELLLDPYCLGVWLGDGSTCQEIVTTQDEEIVKIFEECGFPCTVAQNRGTYKMYRPHGLWKKLKKIGVARNKHIPDEYLYTNIENRRSLLQGLMDSDGCCAKNNWGQCSFTNTNINLASGVRFLAMSLGMQPTLTRRYISKNPNHNDQFLVTFIGIKSEKPFRLERKLNRCMDTRHHDGRYVKEIIQVESKPVNCIQVRSMAGLYLAGESLVVTHNSKHFNIRVYDDVITEKTANSPEMIKKAEEQFRLSDNLGTLSGINWQRIIGTIYNHGDFYCTIIDETKNGAYDWNVRKFVWYQGHYTEEEIIELGISEEYIKVFGYRKPRLLDWQQALSKRKKQGSYIWSCQNELSPSSSEAAEFKLEWLKRYRTLPDPLSLYVFVDPANEKKKTSDYTVVALVGVDQFDNRFLVDMVRDRLDLGERWKAVRGMVNNYPGVKGVFYEKYGKDSDIWYMEQRQLEEGKYFTIEAIGGGTTKTDRIKRFVPTCRERKFYLPEKPMIYHGQDLVRVFIDEEYTKFPFCRHDDMLDAISRIEDPAVELIKPTSDTYSPRDMGMIEEYYEQISCDEQI